MISVYKIMKVSAQVNAELIHAKSHICRTKAHFIKQRGDFVLKNSKSYILLHSRH